MPRDAPDGELFLLCRSHTPPNHKLRDIGLFVIAEDDTDDDLNIAVVVYSNEDDKGPGVTGQHKPDVVMAADLQLSDIHGFRCV